MGNARKGSQMKSARQGRHGDLHNDPQYKPVAKLPDAVVRPSAHNATVTQILSQAMDNKVPSGFTREALWAAKQVVEGGMYAPETLANIEQAIAEAKR